MRRRIRGQWTDRKARHATLKILESIDTLWLELAEVWGEEDQSIVDLCDEQRSVILNNASELPRFWKDRDAERKAERPLR